MQTKNYNIYKNRRAELVKQVFEQYKRSGAIILFGDYERDRVRFRQESSVYYYTGLTEPGIVAIIEMSGRTVLFIPRYQTNRAQWMSDMIDKEHPEHYGVDEIHYLGDPVSGYTLSPFSADEALSNLTTYFSDLINKGEAFFITDRSIDQKIMLSRYKQKIAGFDQAIVNVTSIIAPMRRVKSKAEIELIYKAIDITIAAQEGAAYVLAEQKKESDIQAVIEYIFTESQARPAFPSIVASGINGTVLHYTQNNAVLIKNDLVVVDIGAESNYYCADLTRTYPVSGKFSKRQRELYEIVLQAQELVAAHAKPGNWLNNKEKPEQSLQHVAYNFFAHYKLEKYFIHGIGHFLGLDVHDVGDVRLPLQEGDVITIEPGLYIPEERIGIRIEDNYWIIKDGSICLSEDLPRHPQEIEQMARESFTKTGSDQNQHSKKKSIH